MRSWIGRVVFGLGGFLVVAGLLGLVWAPGVVEKTPVDVKTITYLDGEAGKLDASTITIESASSSTEGGRHQSP